MFISHDSIYHLNTRRNYLIVHNLHAIQQLKTKSVSHELCFVSFLEFPHFQQNRNIRTYIVIARDETIWRYIDTVSIRRLTIRIVAQRDISRYDLGICNQGKSPCCLYFFVFDECFVFVQET